MASVVERPLTKPCMWGCGGGSVQRSLWSIILSMIFDEQLRSVMGRYVTCGPGLGMGMIIARFQWAGSRPRRRDLFIRARRRQRHSSGALRRSS